MAIESYIGVNLKHFCMDWGKLTLIIPKRKLTDPKTALAGVMLEISFPRSKVAMATVNNETARSPPFVGWHLEAIVEPRGSREKSVRCKGREETPKP